MEVPSFLCGSYEHLRENSNPVLELRGTLKEPAGSAALPKELIVTSLNFTSAPAKSNVGLYILEKLLEIVDE